MFDGLSAYRQQWFTGARAARADILAGIVVALALIPEAIGFSLIAGVDPRVGLYASIAIAIVLSFTGGRPGLISAATAAVDRKRPRLTSSHKFAPPMPSTD